MGQLRALRTACGMRGVQVTDDGDVVLSQGAINGFLGGSVAPHPPQPAAHRTRLPASVVPAAPSLHPPRRHATPPHRAPLRTHRCIPSLRHSQHPYATPPPRPLLDPLLDPSPAGGRGGHADSHLRQARSGQGPAQVPLLRGHWHHSVRLTTPPPRLTAEPHSQGAALTSHPPGLRIASRVAPRTSPTRPSPSLRHIRCMHMHTQYRAYTMHIPCQVRAVPRQLTARIARRGHWGGPSSPRPISQLWHNPACPRPSAPAPHSCPAPSLQPNAPPTGMPPPLPLGS